MLNFQDVYAAYAPEVYRFAFWLSGDGLEAEDITSETFVRAWVKRDVIRTETLKAYLFTIARNAFLERRRKSKRRAVLEDSYPDPSPGPPQQAEARLELQKVGNLLQTLPEVDRTAFILRVQHELPCAEIARILELSLSAVKVKIYRVRKKLLSAGAEKEVR